MALTRDLVLQIRAVNRANKALASVRSQIEQIHAATQALNTGQPVTGKGMGQVEAQAKRTGKAIKDLDKSILKTTNTHKRLDGVMVKTTKHFDNQGKEITSLTRQMSHLKIQTQEVGKKMGMLQGFMRGLTNSTRVSAEGFGKMIANNVTWLAGFALISATIGTVIKLFSDLTDRQNQFVKVSRLIATAVDDENQRVFANVLAYQEMTKQMARTGRSAEEVVEAQYQLLSAGLSLEQVNQGLGSSLDLIDAAMDDITQTTKLLAGIMNNYGETMYKTADGQVVFANSTRAVKEGLSDTVTEGEKMAAVSNLLAIAFDKHQAEVNELRDGLKFSIPAARAAGIGLDELTATLVTLEDHMIKSGRAGRSLRIMLAQIAKKPELMQKHFKTMFDPTEVDPFISFLVRAGEEFDKIPNKAEKLAVAYEVFTTRGADAFIQVTAEGGKLVSSLDELREKGKQVDEVMADIVRTSPDRQFKRLWYSIVNLVDAMGGGGLIKAFAEFTGEVATAVQTIAEGVDWINRFTMAIKEYARVKAEASEGKGSLAGSFKLIQAEDPLVRIKKATDDLNKVLFGENYKAGMEMINEWINSTLKIKDAEEEVRKGIENTVKALEEQTLSVEDAYKQNLVLAESMEFISNLGSSMKIGNQMAAGLITAIEAVKMLNDQFALSKDEAAFTKIDEDIVVFSINVDQAKDKVKFLNDFIKNTGTAALDGFKRATEAVAKFNEELKTIANETSKINVEMAELGGKGASRLLGLANSLGLGASAGMKFLDSSKNLTDQIKKLKEEYDKAFYAGAKQEELVAIQEKITKVQKEERDVRDKSTAAIAIAIPLIERQLKSAEKLAKVQKTQAKDQRAIAGDISKTAIEREAASKSEEASLEKQMKAIEEAAKQQEQLDKIRWKQGLIGEDQYNRSVANLYDETATKIERIQKQIGASQKTRLELQGQKEEEAKKKMKEAQAVLERYDGLIKNIAKAINDSNISEFAGTMAKAFEDAKQPVIEVKDEIIEISEELDRLTSKVHRIEIEKTIETINKSGSGSESAARGGLAGYAAITNVSSGEGFVPPSVVKHNLPALQALNQGNAVPARFPIERFSGASGIDNIQTSLPAGSFVISRRGMDALERSSNRANDASERRNFQLGGVVGGGAIGDRTTDDQGQQQTSRFDLVLNVGGEERRFPLSGAKTIIDELAGELDRQNLVRL